MKWAAAAAVGGSTLGLVPSIAQAAPGPPININLSFTGTSPTAGQLTIDWDNPNTGTQWTYFKVEVDKDADGDVDSVIFTDADTTIATQAATYATSYRVNVIAADGTDETASGFLPAAPFVTPNAPVAPGNPCAVAIWNPFCTVDAYIRQQYGDFLDRSPRLDELNQWRQWMNAGVRNYTDTSQEAVFLNSLRETDDIVAGPVIRLYEAYFLRHPEFSGYQYWRSEVLTGNRSLGQVSEFFASSREFQNRYGSLDDAEFVSLVYRNVLGRQPDAAGQQYWERQLQSGRTRGWMMAQFSEAPSGEFQRKTGTIVALTEITAAMLNRMPTLEEYDYAANTLMAGTQWPFDDGTDGGSVEVWPIFDWIVNKAHTEPTTSLNVYDDYAGRITPN